MGAMQPWALYFFAAMTLVTFLAFGWDKRKARTGSRNRTPEGTLLTLSFLGGFVGGWVGMNIFRHKTRKLGFKLKMAAVSVVNPVWLFVWFWLEESLA
jgi:uncharacterized membrane protein YsdA (DUF1294 family)